MKKLLAMLLALALFVSACPFSFAEDGCRVLVTDENGNGIEGVSVLLCTDSVCYAEATDENGIAVFDEPDTEEYDVRILEVPEDYAENTEIKSGTDLRFVLKEKEHFPVPEKSYAALEDINFADYKLILVNYWEPWCSWCLAEMPDLEELWQEYRDRGLLIVGMYHDERGAKEAIEKYGITYPIIRYTEKSSYTLSGVPTSVFYDGERNVLPAAAEDYVDELTEEFRISIAALNFGAFDGIEDKEIAEYIKVLQELVDDEEKLHDYCLKTAEEYAAQSEAFIGYANLDSWRTRIENRLA